MISLSNTPSKSFVPSNSLRESALVWYEYGYNVIPLIPCFKQTAIKWDGWLAGLSLPKITAYWLQNPTHELGFIVGEDIIVLDADSPESVAALVALEETHGIKPNLIIKTKKGVHHHFKRAAGTVAKSNSYCTKQYPERIDVKTGRAMVILPPSTGKSIAVNETNNASELTEVGQDFIEAINRHNGRKTQPSSSQSSLVVRNPANSENGYLGLQALLAHIDSDCGYDDWLRVLMGIFHYTNGNVDGFEIANNWSSAVSKYDGENEIRAKWNSFDLDHPRPVTIGTIIYMVKDGLEIYQAAEDQFEIITDVDTGGAK
jgi:hypothetical protein